MDLASKDDLDAASQERLEALQEFLTLVLSADYKMTKFILFWGETAILYYLRKVSLTCLGLSTITINQSTSLHLMSISITFGSTGGVRI